MKFSTRHQRTITGNDIVVRVEAEGKELIAKVTTALDGSEIGADALELPGVSYEREFSRVGSAGPHMEHDLTITVADADGKTKIVVRKWADAV
jgi:hypothetical protein